MDGIQVMLLMLAFFTVTSLLLFIDRFYNAHFITTRMVGKFPNESYACDFFTALICMKSMVGMVGKIQNESYAYDLFTALNSTNQVGAARIVSEV